MFNYFQPNRRINNLQTILNIIYISSTLDGLDFKRIPLGPLIYCLHFSYLEFVYNIGTQISDRSEKNQELAIFPKTTSFASYVS